MHAHTHKLFLKNLFSKCGRYRWVHSQKEPLRAAIKTSVNFVHNADGTRLTRSFMASSSATAIWIMHWLSYSLWHQLNFVSQNLLMRLRGVVSNVRQLNHRWDWSRVEIPSSILAVVLLIIHEPRHLSKPLRYMYVEKYQKKKADTTITDYEMRASRFAFRGAFLIVHNLSGR